MLRPYADSWAGDPLAEVLCLKGIPGPAELAGGAVCSGTDGDALAKAVIALGYDEGAWAAVDVTRLDAQGLRVVIEAIDPQAILTLDGPAREAFVRACSVAESRSPASEGAEAPGDSASSGASITRPRSADDLPFGVAVRVGGRVVVAIDRFETSLADDSKKRISWHQMKAATRNRVLL